MPTLPKTLQLTLLPVLASAALQGATYTVKAGDTLSSIARRNGTTAAKLMSANGIGDPKLLKVGQTLQIGGSASPASAPKTSSGSTSSHTVQAGETLYSISRAHGVSVSQLTALNPGLDPSKLSIGQKIKTTGSATKPAPKPEPAPQPEVVKKPEPEPAPKPVVAEKKPDPKPEPAPAVAAQTPPTPKPATANVTAEKTEKEIELPKPAPSSIASVMVDKEISFGALASQHQTSTQQLNELNGWSLKPTTVLAKGSEIYVPGL